MAVEVVTQLGDTLLEVVIVDGDHALAGTTVVRDGKIVGDASGRVGLVEYDIREVTAPARDLRYARGDDLRLAPYIAVVLAAHLGLWRAASAEVADPHASAAARSRPTHVARAFAHADHVPPDALAHDTAPDTKARGQGLAAMGPAGALGADRAIAPRSHVAVTNTGEEAQLAKSELLAQARRAGILGRSQAIVESYQSLVGTDHLTSGFDPASVNGALDGDGAGHGAFGGSRTGLADGGGGAGWGTIGTGASGAFSDGAAFGHGWGGRLQPIGTWAGRSWHDGDYVNASIPHRLRHDSLAICGAADRARCRVTGELDPAIVRRYVRRRSNALAYCFEQVLLQTPGATGGKVLVDLAIGADGHVEEGSANAEGIALPVAACVAEVVRALEFPRAAGPTQVAYVLAYRR